MRTFENKFTNQIPKESKKKVKTKSDERREALEKYMNKLKVK